METDIYSQSLTDKYTLPLFNLNETESNKTNNNLSGNLSTNNYKDYQDYMETVDKAKNDLSIGNKLLEELIKLQKTKQVKESLKCEKEKVDTKQTETKGGVSNSGKIFLRFNGDIFERFTIEKKEYVINKENVTYVYRFKLEK